MRNGHSFDAHLKRIFLLISVFVFLLHTHATKAQFEINGDAFQSNDSCYVITPDIQSQSGSIWSQDKINLLNPFDIKFRMHFGCPNGQPGADGFVVALQPISNTVGSLGGGLGFEGITPSLGVEFDTYRNASPYNDPVEDHMAIIQNGDVNHATSNNLAGPVSVHPQGDGIEDCVFHWVRITWNPDSNLFRVYYDCDVRLFYQGDIVNDIFNGDPEVYWGVTGSTGFYHNRQEVCILDTTFYEVEPMADQSRCTSDSISLSVGRGNLYKTTWIPTTFISDPNSADVLVYPQETTTYFAESEDECQQKTYDTVTIFVPDTLYWPDDTICVGESIELQFEEMENVSRYAWNDNEGETIQITEGGEYVSEITQFDCIVRDTVTITEINCEIPNIITPNNDLMNEMLDLSAAMEGEPEKWDMRVFNRWGKEVFSESPYTNQWNGDQLPEGMYYYQLSHQELRKTVEGWFRISR